jgi:hypothetical protein
MEPRNPMTRNLSPKFRKRNLIHAKPNSQNGFAGPMIQNQSDAIAAMIGKTRSASAQT